MSTSHTPSALTSWLRGTVSSTARRVVLRVGRGSSPTLAADSVHRMLELDGLTVHAIGAPEDLPAAGSRVTLHESREAAAIDKTVANLLSSGGVDALIQLPDSESAGLPLVAGDKAAGSAVGVTVAMPAALARPLFLADTVVHDSLDVVRGESVVETVIPCLASLGITPPRIAALAAVEVPNPGLPVTVWGDELARRFADREDVFVQGPLSMDLAVSRTAAEKKKASGEVPGRADLLLAPSLVVARGVRDALAFGAAEPTATVIVGADIPIACPARGTGTDGVLNSLLLALSLRR